MTALIAAAALAVGAVIGLAIYHVRVRAAIASADPEVTGSGSLARALDRSRRQRERAESDAAAARLDLRRLRAVLDELETGIVVCDRGGEVVARNRAAAAFAAARHEEALVSRAVAELLERARSGEAGAQSVELATHPRRAYHVEAAPVVEAGDEPGPGTALGAVACVYDVTDQQRTDAVRRDFVANMSHELKTPVGALSLLAEALGAESSAGDEALVSRIREEAQRVARTIDDLMVLSYVEGEAPLDEPVDVGAVVAGAVERISEAADQRRVEVRAPDPAPSAPMRGSPQPPDRRHRPGPGHSPPRRPKPRRQARSRLPRRRRLNLHHPPPVAQRPVTRDCGQAAAAVNSFREYWANRTVDPSRHQFSTCPCKA